jgi:hypothetical protein
MAKLSMKDHIRNAWASAVGADPESLDDWPIDRIAEAIELIDSLDDPSCMFQSLDEQTRLLCLFVQSLKRPGVAEKAAKFLEAVDVHITLNVMDL